MQKILVLELYRQTLSVVRSLSREFTVILGVPKGDIEQHYIQYSRSVSETWLHTDFEISPDSFLEELLAYVNCHSDIAAIFPVGEDSLRLLCQYRDRLPDHVRLVATSNSNIDICLDKPSSIEKMDGLGIPCPKSSLVETSDEAREFTSKNGFPVILKPVDSRTLYFKQKCLFIDNESELDSIFARSADLPSQGLVQQKALGFRHNCMFVAKNGELVNYFESKVIRTTALNGTGYSVLDISVKPSSLHLDWCKTFLSATNYSGIGCIQFLVDEVTGKSVFLEVNPRIDATLAIANSSGLDLALSAAKVALGQAVQPSFEYQVGVKRQWFFGDMQVLRQGLSEGSLKGRALVIRCLSVLFHMFFASAHTTWQWRDPKPSVRLYSSHIFKWAAKKFVWWKRKE